MSIKQVKFPFSNGYQGRIIASILKDPDFLCQCREAIDPSYFDLDDHQLIVGSILTFYDKHHSRPRRDILVEEIATRGRQLDWEPKQVTQLTTEVDRLVALDNTDAEIISIKERAVQFGQHQALKTAILECADLIEKSEKDPDSKELEKMFPILQRAAMVGQAHSTGVNVLEYLTNPRKISEDDVIADPRYLVPTGFAKLDKYCLDGGLGAGELGIIMAESNKGKSMLLTNISHAAVRGRKKVLYFTMELKAYEVACRLFALMFSCTIKQVKDRDPCYTIPAQLVLDKIHQEKESGVGFSSLCQVVYFKPSQANVLSLRASISRLETMQGWTPDLIVVDYIDEMRGVATGRRGDEETSYNMYGNIAADLIDLGVDYRCPIWTAAQVQREAYKEGDIELHHMGRSMQKVDKADLILAIVQSKDEKQTKEVRLKILKNRRGGGKDYPIRCKVDFERALFTEMASKATTGPQKRSGS